MTILDDVPRKHLKVLEAVCDDMSKQRDKRWCDELDDLIDAVTIDDLEQWAKQPMP